MTSTLGGAETAGPVGLAVNALSVLGALACAFAMPRAVRAFAPFDGEQPRGEVPARWVFVLVTTLAVAAVCLVMGNRPWLPAYVYLAAVGVLLAAVDLRVHRLPDRIVLPSYLVLGALFTEALAVAPHGAGWQTARLAHAAVAAGALLVLFGLLYALPRSGLGLGDVKLAGLLGAALGFLGSVQLALGGLLLGLLGAGLYAGLLLVTRRARGSDPLAYGPPLILGAYAAILLASRPV